MLIKHMNNSEYYKENNAYKTISKKRLDTYLIFNRLVLIRNQNRIIWSEKIEHYSHVRCTLKSRGIRSGFR